MLKFFSWSLHYYFLQTAPPLLARWVPFIAVASANCVNIPLTRQRLVVSFEDQHFIDFYHLSYPYSCYHYQTILFVCLWLSDGSLYNNYNNSWGINTVQ